MAILREEINRVREIMGISILNEAPISSNTKKQALLKTIQRAEHKQKDWDDPYQIVYGSAKVPQLTEMTAGEWRASLGNGKKTSDPNYDRGTRRLPERFGGGKIPWKVDGYGSRATGAYQIMPGTLQYIFDRSGPINNSDIMNRAKQDELGLWLASVKRRVDVDNLPEDLTASIVDELAMEWASLPHSAKGDRSYYGQGGYPIKTIRKWYKELLGLPHDELTPIVYKPEDSSTDGPTNLTSILNGEDVIQRGDTGDLVTNLQRILVYDYSIDIGAYGASLDGVDGKFGRETQRGVEEFQESMGMVIDGIVGICTMDALLEGTPHYCCEAGGCNDDDCKKQNWCNVTVKGSNKKVKVDKDDSGSGTNINDITPSKKLPGNFAEIPGGQGNFRSEQPTEREFALIFELYPEIKRVIRMNGNKDRGDGGPTKSREEKIVTDSGREYIYVSAHKPRIGGGANYEDGYSESREVAVNILLQGDTLIHCTHGADRTGYAVASYIQDKLGWSTEKLWEYTTGPSPEGLIGPAKGIGGSFNRWSRIMCNGNGYQYYLASFYPIEEWCNADKSNRLNNRGCKICRNYS